MSPNEAARAAYQSSSHLLVLLENRTLVRAKQDNGRRFAPIFINRRKAPQLGDFCWGAGPFAGGKVLRRVASLNGLEGAEGSGDLHPHGAPARQGCCPRMACPPYRNWLGGGAFTKEGGAQECSPRWPIGRAGLSLIVWLGGAT